MVRHLLAFVVLIVAAPAAQAWEFRARFVERLGIEPPPIVDNTIDASSLQPRRIAIQFGVFDDTAGPAPEGGFLAWNSGSIAVSGPEDNSDESRTPGRLAPFRQGPVPEGNGDPSGDPFTALTGIHASLGAQSFMWMFGNPMPAPVIRGLNTFVSVYEITIDPREGATNYDITFSGDLLAASQWQVVGTPVPPTSPENPGSVNYEPIPTDPLPFSLTLHVVVPAPAGAFMMIPLAATALRRRRNRLSTARASKKS
jgi:hypothetical protein